ncbi:hypothetical protein NLI96_g7750 [Meripilus lineatus]|uniref:Thaumatin-like protein n=1 Tax=Meripilus lineatus TaxID=2056292 RepID=A0AAD5YGW1_9APHY|nr:hypothetical protein NLI96_g7750 [Physisporinus lineatus]
MHTDKSSPSFPDYQTGWEAQPYTQVNFHVPDDWKSGRIWGRRGCNFADPAPGTQCPSGGCNGGLICNPVDGSGIPPATLAEFSLSAYGNMDNYDVSVVDGYNLPMSVTNNKGCPIAGCFVDLGPNCPAPLKGPFDSNGFPVGCKSACLVDQNKSDSPNCCTGSHNTQETCPPDGVQYYHYFKDNCPRAYAYAYDDPSSLYTCDASLSADYTITFCPPPPSLTVMDVV